MVADPSRKGIASREEGGLKADGIKQGAKSVPLLATSGHVGDQFALTEERRRPPVGVLEPVKQFGRVLCKAGADEAARDGVEPVLVVQRERRTRLSPESNTSCAIRPPISAPFLTLISSWTGRRE